MNKQIVLSIILLSQAINVCFAGGRSSDAPNMMDRFLTKAPAAFQSQGNSATLPTSNAVVGSSSSVTSSTTTSSAATSACSVIPSESNALVVTKADPDNEINLNANFGLRRTLQKIIDTSGSATTTTPEELFRSMREGYENSDGSLRLEHSNNGVTMPVDPRPSELDFIISGDFIDATDVIDEMEPTGIFNRIDLAAGDGSNCGEYRVVYHWIKGAVDQFGGFEGGSKKFFIIFEAAYPNPSPAKGLAGCLPVAHFWESLNAISDSSVLIAKLAEFYFDGIDQDGVSLPAVINFNHYAQNSGQVRVNTFVNTNIFPGPIENPQMWQLREFRTAQVANDIVFAVDTVKVNPLAELYADSLPASLSHLPSNFITDFQNDFVDNVVEGLVAPELANMQTQTEIVNSIQMTDLPKYNEFQSNTGPGAGSRPDNQTDAIAPGDNFKAAVTQKLASLAIPATITADHIFVRARAMSCSGCHRVAQNSGEIAPGILWPQTGAGFEQGTRFVQIHEKGGLSRVLTDHFLVGRANALTDFICNPPTVDFVDVITPANWLILD